MLQHNTLNSQSSWHVRLCASRRSKQTRHLLARGALLLSFIALPAIHPPLLRAADEPTDPSQASGETAAPPNAAAPQTSGGAPPPGSTDNKPRPKDAVKCNGKNILAFTMDSTGNVSDKGKSVEGPAYIQVHFNPVQYQVSIAALESRTAGPDPSSAILGKASRQAEAIPKKLAAESLEKEFDNIEDSAHTYQDRARKLPQEYNDALDAQLGVITAIRQHLNAIAGIDASTDALSNAVNNGFQHDLGPKIDEARSKQEAFQPPDKGSPSLLAELQRPLAELNQLPFKYSDKWDEWYKSHKDLYDRLGKNVQDAIAAAQQYATSSDNLKTLKAKTAIVNYWDGLFRNIGLVAGGPQGQSPNISRFSVVKHEVPCGTLFNQTSSTAVSLVTIDQAPTLDGNAPTVRTRDAFLTVVCTTRFSVSAGVGFGVTIRQKEFAIIKSAGGANNVSVNKFDTLADSRFRPLPMALVHVRVAETEGHLIAGHVTVGIAGNIQGQDSGGSSADFLVGGSVSFARTLYFSLGLHIGTKAELAGGFKKGDTVPTDITTIQGQVKRSYTPGLGFALSFSKP